MNLRKPVRRKMPEFLKITSKLKTDVKKPEQRRSNLKESTVENQPTLKVLRPSGWRVAVEAVGYLCYQDARLNCELRPHKELHVLLDERLQSSNDEHVRKLLGANKVYSKDYNPCRGRPNWQRPAEEMESVKRQKLEALEKIENDPTVKQAIKMFDGTLDLSVSLIEIKGETQMEKVLMGS